MKLYKSLLFGLLVCGMAACDTTDLERDINSLKDRVEDYEAQVQKLNDDMNIIRVLLDGNKTITSYSFDGANYTLTLSNGETLTLTQGVVGANYPSITIGENGNWIIAGVDSGKRAEAEDGEDAPYTPQFKVENENWCVSLDGGATWQNLGVKATGTASGTSPISDVEFSDNNLTITLSGGSSYTIPVVKDLVCEITEPELADGEMWYVGAGTPATLKVKVNIQSGDIIRPVVPADWKAEITTPGYAGLSGEQTLEVAVTAPSTASKCVVTMEVNRGINTITDEIVARTETTGYYADFMAGFEVQLGDYTLIKKGQKIIINGESYDDLNVTHISSASSSQDITADGVYFIDSDVDATYSRTGGGTKIIIGNSPTTKTPLTLNQSLTLGTAQSSLFCKNIEITLDDANNSTRILTVNNPQKIVVFEDCKFNIKASSSPQFIYQTNSERTFDLVFESCRFNLDINYTILGLGTNTSKYNLTFKNNIFCSSTEAVNAFKLFTVGYANESGGAQNLILQNNTFYNVHSGTSGMINGYIGKLTMSSNLFENDYEPSNNLVFLRRIANSSDKLYQNDGLTGTIESNYGYINSSSRIWQIQYGGTNPIDGTNGIIKDSESLFESVELSDGIFKVKEKYKGLGSDL